MSGQPHTIASTDTVYQYDGGLVGFYCCVYESITCRELPAAIGNAQTLEPSLFLTKAIISDEERANQVRQAIERKIAPRGRQLAENVFLSCLPQKELAILRFLITGFQHGAKALGMLGHPDVHAVLAAEKHLLGEAQLLRGFLRFADYDGILVGAITPKNFVLPYLAPHFKHRYRNERFLIYDKTHQAALVYRDRQLSLVPLASLELAEPSAAESQYQELWKRFYRTIAIEARRNPRCRQTHMPKRYWSNMLEVVDEL